MNEQEKFEAWYESAIWGNEDYKESLLIAWQACAEQKDKEIAELKDTINSYEVDLANATAYLESAKYDIAALKELLRHTYTDEHVTFQMDYKDLHIRERFSIHNTQAAKKIADMMMFKLIREIK